MGVPQAMEALGARASSIRDALHKSQTITDNMVSILGSFDHRLSALETAMRPTQIRTHSIRRAHENIDKTLKAVEVILGQFDLTRKAEAKILRGPHEDLESYLEAIDQLRSIIHFFSSHKNVKSSDGVLHHANNLLSKAISKLEDEFRQLLINYSKPVEPDRLFDCLPDSLRPDPAGQKNEASGKGSDHPNKSLKPVIYTPLTLIPPMVLPLLHDLAQQMVLAGHQQQLFRTYRDTRGSVLEQSLRKLGVERLTKDDVQKMQWEVFEAKIGNWIHYMRIAVKLLFTGEKKICDKIFEGAESLKDPCFAEVTANSVAVLLSFVSTEHDKSTIRKEIFLHLRKWICPPVLLEKVLEFLEDSLLGKVCNDTLSGKAVWEKHLTSLLPFVPKLVSQVADDWKSRLLQAFSEAFKDCHPVFPLKLVCLSILEEMLVPRQDMLYLDPSIPKILDFQIIWIRELPVLLILLGDKIPYYSQVVLHLLLCLGQRALVNSSFAWEYDNMQLSLQEFFGISQDDVKSPFSPDLEQYVIFRIMEVLNSAYKSGHIQIVDHISFLITLLSHFRVFPENIHPVRERDVNISNQRTFKLLSQIVCSCLSQMGDNSLVFQMLEKMILDQMSQNPSLDNICAMLRV